MHTYILREVSLGSCPSSLPSPPPLLPPAPKGVGSSPMTAGDSAAQTHGGLWAILPEERSITAQTHCHFHSQANALLYFCKAKRKEVEFFIGQLKQRFSPLWVCVGVCGCVWVGWGVTQVECIYDFTSRPFQAKTGLPREGGVKKNTLPVKQQVGFKPGTFWSTVT